MTTPSSPPEAAADRFRCGTLVYTKAGLFTLFLWILWGDFCFTLMEQIYPSILPLVLKSAGMSDTLISLAMTTIPSALNFVFNPIISTASDRCRSKLGRRIPFLLFSAPFITLFLVLLGFSKELGRGLHGLLAHGFLTLSPAACTLGLLWLFIIGFSFFNLFANTIFWYLFNDVVPTPFMGRFLGLMRIVGALASGVFNFFLFKYAESHTGIIFFGAALLYFTAFLMMCLKVKEGEYPPPDPIVKKEGHFFNFVQTYFKECVSHRIFRLVFYASCANGFALAANSFVTLYGLSVGLTLEQLGKVVGVAGFASMLLTYPAGILMDKLHPIRLMIFAQIGYFVIPPIRLVYLFWDFSPNAAFWIWAIVMALFLPFSVTNWAANLPVLMRIFPQERFGQFCSANAMFFALMNILGGVLFGAFLDMLRAVTGKGDFCYRFLPVWGSFFAGLSLMAWILVYREWKKLGGDNSYHPPLPDKFAELFQKQECGSSMASAETGAK